MPKRSRSGLDAACAGALADHDIDLEILQRGVEDLLDNRRKPMDLVDEKNVVALQIREQRREVARAFEHGPRSLAKVDGELVRDDVR